MLLSRAEANVAVDYLNDLLKLDRPAISVLVETRVSCLPLLAAHDTCQCHVDERNRPMIGLLGVLNGLFGVIDQGENSSRGHITAICDMDENITKFALTEDLAEVQS